MTNVATSPLMVMIKDWEAFLARSTTAHLLQTAAWGTLKSSFGWSVEHIIVGNSGVQILLRSTPLGMGFAYIAKGPIGNDWGDLWPVVDAVCRRKRAVFIKVEPDLWINSAKDEYPPNGFQPSLHSIQPLRTLIVDLNGDEESILGRMKQKTRYNIKLAQKRNVIVRPSDDLEAFYRLMLVTGGRDKFGIHSQAYYKRAYQLFHSLGSCELLLAEFEGQPLASLMVFTHGIRAWYLYGASSNEHRDRMPTYLLQWEAMRWARSRGCTEYDLWGVPDTDEYTLETEFTHRADGLWGVYRNKRGFGGTLQRAAGPWDRVYSPLAYRLYCWWVSHRSSIPG